MEVKVRFTFIVFYMILQFCCARIHKLEIKNDTCRYNSLSKFGFYKGGKLDVKLHNFHSTPFREEDIFGFSFDRILRDAVGNDGCQSQQAQSNMNDFGTDTDYEIGTIIYFKFDIKNLRLKVSCIHKRSSLSDLSSIQIYRSASEIASFQQERDSVTSQFSGPDLLRQLEQRNTSATQGNQRVKRSSEPSGCENLDNVYLPLNVTESSGGKYFSTNFVVYIASEKDEGVYNLYFHNFPNYRDDGSVAVNFTIDIEENNNGNFLSAGEMPLPTLYSMMAIIFFISGCFWVFILYKSEHPVCKIHYFMTVLVYLKSLSLMFHGIDYNFIQMKGEHMTKWMELYDILHLLKAVFLFITIVLLGSGWTFIKPMLSGKDKITLIIIIPLQVVANVADIAVVRFKEDAVENHTLKSVFILADLLSCGIILFPVLRSMRHLKRASHTRGKAALNLLRLFRHFLVMIVCYIYFTRITVYLLQITLPFNNMWVVDLFLEMSSCVFYVLTGYKFRPSLAKPYFSVNDDDKEEIDVRVKKLGLMEGLSKIDSIRRTSADEMFIEEKDNLLSKREASHEFD